MVQYAVQNWLKPGLSLRIFRHSYCGQVVQKSHSSTPKFTRPHLERTNRVPTRTGKPGKMGRHFPVREKSGNFEQTGKVRENHTKYWKPQGIWDKYYLIFLYIIFSDIWMNCVLFTKMDQVFSKENKTLKKYWKIEKKYCKSPGILSVRKSGNPDEVHVGEWTEALIRPGSRALRRALEALGFKVL